MELLASMYGEGMGVSSLLVMVTLGLDLCIGNSMPLINSEFKVGLDNLLGIHTKSLQLDHGSMPNKLLKHKIISELCAHGALLQNGEVERRYQTWINIVKSMIKSGSSEDIC